MPLIVKPVGVAEGRVFKAELPCLFVHFFSKAYLVAAERARQGGRGVVAGIEHHAVQKLAHSVALAGICIHARALNGAPFWFNDYFVVEIGVFNGNNSRHDLCYAGDEHALVRVFFKQHIASIGAQDYSTVCRQLVLLIGKSRKWQQRDCAGSSDNG